MIELPAAPVFRGSVDLLGSLVITRRGGDADLNWNANY
jgi:hypothetical protein